MNGHFVLFLMLSRRWYLEVQQLWFRSPEREAVGVYYSELTYVLLKKQCKLQSSLHVL